MAACSRRGDPWIPARGVVCRGAYAGEGVLVVAATPEKTHQWPGSGPGCWPADAPRPSRVLFRMRGLHGQRCRCRSDTRSTAQGAATDEKSRIIYSAMPRLRHRLSRWRPPGVLAPWISQASTLLAANRTGASSPCCLRPARHHRRSPPSASRPRPSASNSHTRHASKPGLSVPAPPAI